MLSVDADNETEFNRISTFHSTNAAFTWLSYNHIKSSSTEIKCFRWDKKRFLTRGTVRNARVERRFDVRLKSRHRLL